MCSSDLGACAGREHPHPGGGAGFIGTLGVSTLLNARFYQTLMTISLLMALIAGTLLLVGHHAWTVAVLLSLWGMLATAAPTGWWTWIARTLPDDAEAGGGLMVAVIQLSIALNNPHSSGMPGTANSPKPASPPRSTSSSSTTATTTAPSPPTNTLP